MKGVQSAIPSSFILPPSSFRSGGLVFAFITAGSVFLYCSRPDRMRERPENFNTDNDTEATLVAPRFDADDARRAHPVVPLAEAPPSAPFASAPRALYGGRGLRR